MEIFASEMLPHSEVQDVKARDLARWNDEMRFCIPS
jgi:hypothetical protein